MTQKKTKLGVLALMLEDYLPLFPGIDRAQTAYVNEVLDGLRDAAEFVFPHAAMNRAQIESLVAQYNHEKLDGILILLLTYSQGAYLVRALEENHLPLALPSSSRSRPSVRTLLSGIIRSIRASMAVRIRRTS